MNVFSPDCASFHHAGRLQLPQSAAPSIWRRWCALSMWPDWDVSLSDVIAESDGLALGRSFHIVPKASGIRIPVRVVSFCEGIHFTTASVGPLGLVSFGHTLVAEASPGCVSLEHTICAAPVDEETFAARVWSRLVADVDDAVAALARRVSQENAA
jgi:hypothetical protein